ncbi:putative polysaccharide biosynthesis protein [Salipaludibacillus sp. HK11]|uniref:putative polysaccharide biosynthesis protein n=1 Tax=Salipaludibacillus sp. HK11 TaxID=3394320 RepID=UPI0039FD0E92
MIESRQKQTWLRGALYLSLAAFVVKLLSAVYKIPYQNITGDIGFYVYQQVYPLYGVVFVLGAYGFPLVIAKIVAANDGDKPGDLSYMMQRLTFLFLCLFFIHASLGIIIIATADGIAEMMGDAQLALAVRWMAAPFFLIPFLAIGRGAYQGVGELIPTAISQVAEQVIRVSVILVVAIWAMQGNNPYLAGTSAGIGASFGSLAGVTVLYVMWKKNRDIFLVKSFNWSLPNGWWKDLKTLLVAGTFVSISAMALIIFQLIDSLMIFRLLESSGWSMAKAAIEKGVYDRGWPLIQFGAVITTVFSYAAIPHIARAYEAGRLFDAKEEIRRSVKVCFVFGGAAAMGIVMIMPSLNKMMFTDYQGTMTLQLITSVVFFGAIFMTVAGLLHAVGKAVVSVYILIGGILLKISFNFAFIPAYGIFGAALASVMPFVIMALVSLGVLIRLSLWKPESFHFWWKWLLSLFGMIVFLSIYQAGMERLLPNGRGAEAILSLSSASLGAAIYLWLIYYFRLFTKQEWDHLPKIGRWFPYRAK